MRFLRLGIALGVAAFALPAWAVPTLLIVQTKANRKDKSDPTVDVTVPLSKEFDTLGRVTPIAYSKVDIAFRAAVASGRLKEPTPNPSPREIDDAAKVLGAEYILLVQTNRTGNEVHAKATLYRDRRPIWKDDETLGVSSNSGLESADTARSLARTFIYKMDLGPLKGLPDRPKLAQPTMQPGQEPVIPAAPTPVASQTSDTDLKKSADDLVKANRRDSAILLMRDAVDSRPLDVDRRLALIDLLESFDPTEAAQEARRSATLLPEKVELRVLAARCWMKAGQPAEAQKDLNEAVARDPNGVSTRLLLGEIRLQQLDAAPALAHFDAAIKQQDSAQARFLRAICRALLGGVDGMQIDLAQMAKIDPSPTADDSAHRYALASDILDRALAKDGAEIRTLLTRIVVKPKDADLHDEIEQLQRLIQARTEFLSLLSVPTKLKETNDRRILAHKLLAESLTDILSYSSNPDDETLADARINLGEALKDLAAVREPAKS